MGFFDFTLRPTLFLPLAMLHPVRAYASLLAAGPMKHVVLLFTP